MVLPVWRGGMARANSWHPAYSCAATTLRRRKGSLGEWESGAPTQPARRAPARAARTRNDREKGAMVTRESVADRGGPSPPQPARHRELEARYEVAALGEVALERHGVVARIGRARGVAPMQIGMRKPTSVGEVLHIIGVIS